MESFLRSTFRNRAKNSFGSPALNPQTPLLPELLLFLNYFPFKTGTKTKTVTKTCIFKKTMRKTSLMEGPEGPVGKLV